MDNNQPSPGSNSSPDDTENYQVNKQQLRRAFDRAASHYDEVAVLQREVGERLLERLSLLRKAPQQLADIGSGTGTLTARLSARYKKTDIIAVDLAPRMLQFARQQQSILARWQGRTRYICGDAENLPMADQTVEMIVSNLAIQWCNNLDLVFAEFRRVLKPEGVLMFSTLGPDTLKELRQCWSQVDNHNHVNAFIDMHDIGDALMRAGFAEPVMDMEYFTLTYADLPALTRDLKTLGAHNVTNGRPRGLTGKGRWQKLQTAYEQLRIDGQLPATYEVIYGHAWTGKKPIKSNNGEVHIGIDQIGAHHKK